MLGPSRSSLAEVQDGLAARAGEPGSDGLSAELLEVSALLSRESSLRGTLADSGLEPDRRAALATAVLAGKVSPAAASVVEDVVRRRWSSARDLVDALEILGAEAAFLGAERAGRLDAVEDELFRFARTIAGDDRLAATLSDPAVPDAAKAELVTGLLRGRAADETVRLVGHVIAHPRGRGAEQAVTELVELAARRREELVAEVTVAAPITAEQEQRLAAALGSVYGRTVTLQVAVDPEVLGGVVVRIDDEVIDGSVAQRLAEARRRMGV
ncbi:MAG TPA: F0F1 ATP synthase subunit delta [Jiangellales bacterium]|nr:F0F1 ATP synthase subunit delta [Jiangellales bacterium]